METFHFGSSSCTKQAACSALGSPVGSLQPGKHTSLVGICCFCHSEGCQSAFQFQQSIATRERTVEYRKTNPGLACLIDSRWKKTAQSVHVAFLSLTSEKKRRQKMTPYGSWYCLYGSCVGIRCMAGFKAILYNPEKELWSRLWVILLTRVDFKLTRGTVQLVTGNVIHILPPRKNKLNSVCEVYLRFQPSESNVTAFFFSTKVSTEKLCWRKHKQGIVQQEDCNFERHPLIRQNSDCWQLVRFR